MGEDLGADFGHDTITDFNFAEDIVDVSNTIIASGLDFAGIIALATQDGADVLITFDANNSIRLQNVLLADLTEANFALVENLNLVGTEGPDTLTGGIGNDTIDGLGGDDVLSGGFGADIIFGGTGDDFIFGNEGNDILNGGDGNDTVSGDEGNDTIIDDSASVEGDLLFGGPGDDIILTNGNAHVVGGPGADTITHTGDPTLQNVELDYTGSPSGITLDLLLGTGSGGDAEGDVLSGMHFVTASQFSDTLIVACGA